MPHHSATGALALRPRRHQSYCPAKYTDLPTGSIAEHHTRNALHLGWERGQQLAFKTPTTVEDVLNSRMIAYPF